MVAIMSIKLATLGPLKMMVFRKNFYDVIISVHDVAKKFFIT